MLQRLTYVAPQIVAHHTRARLGISRPWTAQLRSPTAAFTRRLLSPSLRIRTQLELLESKETTIRRRDGTQAR